MKGHVYVLQVSILPVSTFFQIPLMFLSDLEVFLRFYFIILRLNVSKNTN
jgi:hypothetical protein